MYMVCNSNFFYMSWKLTILRNEDELYNNAEAFARTGIIGA